jgi:hypothetical protein
VLSHSDFTATYPNQQTGLILRPVHCKEKKQEFAVNAEHTVHLLDTADKRIVSTTNLERLKV